MSETEERREKESIEIVKVNKEGKIISTQQKPVQYIRLMLPEDVPLELVEIPSGRFYMGGEEIDREKPKHLVSVQSYYMGKYQVTQEQWFVIAKERELKVQRDLNPEPSYFKEGIDNPVESVTWYECVEFCKRLSKLTGEDYGLPSEAQWEYACRAGTTTPFYFGETITTDLANYNNHYQKTTPVGQFPPNAFGLYDLHGNVWEWCADDWHDNYEGAPNDGSAWISNNDSATKILRGGSWFNFPNHCRSAYRSLNLPRSVLNDYGLRVVCCPPRTS